MAGLIEQIAVETHEKSVHFMLEVLEKLSLDSTKVETAMPAQEIADKGPLKTKKNRLN